MAPVPRRSIGTSCGPLTLLLAFAVLTACGDGGNGGSESSGGALASGGTDLGSGGNAGATGVGAASTGGADSGLPPAAACPPAPIPCAPTVLDFGLPGPGSLVSKDGYLYWRNLPETTIGEDRDPNSVLRVPLSGGAPELLATVDGEASGVAVDGTHIYVADRALGIARAPRAGGSLEYLVRTAALMVAIDDTYAYFSSPAASAVARVAKVGGDAVGYNDQPYPTHLAADATHLYWLLHEEAPFTIMSVPKRGGDPSVVAEDLPEKVQRILPADGAVYVSFSRPDRAEASGSIVRYPADGSPGDEILSTVDPLGAMAADADSLYVGTCPIVTGEAMILKLPHAGGTPTIIAQGGLCYATVIVDADHVYFADSGGRDFVVTGDGTISSADKCGCP
ncbi:MAG: hypothetical protein JW751_02820 [Polyangiaceae bacterium]|nr:hypothetical protein [Polyangiaceae bacterium]